MIYALFIYRDVPRIIGHSGFGNLDLEMLKVAMVNGVTLCFNKDDYFFLLFLSIFSLEYY